MKINGDNNVATALESVNPAPSTTPSTSTSTNILNNVDVSAKSSTKAPVALSQAEATARLKQSGVASRESFDAQRVQKSITRSLSGQPAARAKDGDFAKHVAESFPKNYSHDDLMQMGVNKARSMARQGLATTERTAIDSLSNKDFTANTQDFRNTINQVKTLEAQVRQLEQQGADPAEIARVKGQFQAAEQQLTAKYGYTAATAPQPGTQWVDPQFMSGFLNNGQVKSNQFPTKPPVLTPPAPEEVLFKNGRSIVFKGDNGQNITIHNAAEYKTFVADRRKALNMPVTDGDAVGVHLALEGGGGKGKRYNPAVAAMYEIGVVPTSVSGSSAGAIAASLVAAGADPKAVDDFAKDDRLKKLFDVGFDVDGGLFNGKEAFDLFDQKLRELTGIKDRPVTFADLPIPCQILATKYNDSQLPTGKTDLTKIENRIFVFSQETTPNTPVALAVRASMAIPGIYDSVQMVDPVTGRQVELVDGGVLDNLPIGYNKNSLPTVAINLSEANGNNPKNNQGQPKPLPSGQLKPGNAISSGLTGLNMSRAAASGAKDFRETLNPASNVFAMGLPTWNLQNYKQSNSTLKFGYDEKLDPVLDKQSRAVTQEFFRNFLDDLRTPGARGSNLKTPPSPLNFTRDVQLNGKSYQATYKGGDRVDFTTNGQKYSVNIGKDQIENWFCDDLAFHDISSRLQIALNDYLN